MNAEVYWSSPSISYKDYVRKRGHDGATLWLTGLSGSGKSTIANYVARKLFDEGVDVAVLDADNVRYGLNSDLGFSDEDRAENIRRLGEVALLMSQNAQIVLVTAVSPFAKDRSAVRENHRDADIRFFEIYISTHADECARRDTKGLYSRQRMGTYSGLSGVDAPYEIPIDPDLTIDTVNHTIEQCVSQVLVLLDADSV